MPKGYKADGSFAGKVYKKGCPAPITAFKKGQHLGEKNTNWKGGRRIGSGYVLVYSTNHSFNLVREHRLVMEKHFGRRLNSKEIVHHVNGNRLDNRIENLQLLTNSKHARLHNPKKRFCLRGHEFIGENIYIRKDNGNRQCKKCRDIRNKNRKFLSSEHNAESNRNR